MSDITIMCLNNFNKKVENNNTSLGIVKIHFIKIKYIIILQCEVL